MPRVVRQSSMRNELSRGASQANAPSLLEQVLSNTAANPYAGLLENVMDRTQFGRNSELLDKVLRRTENDRLAGEYARRQPGSVGSPWAPRTAPAPLRNAVGGILGRLGMLHHIGGVLAGLIGAGQTDLTGNALIDAVMRWALGLENSDVAMAATEAGPPTMNWNGVAFVCGPLGDPDWFLNGVGQACGGPVGGIAPGSAPHQFPIGSLPASGSGMFQRYIGYVAPFHRWFNVARGSWTTAADKPAMEPGAAATPALLPQHLRRLPWREIARLRQPQNKTMPRAKTQNDWPLGYKAQNELEAELRPMPRPQPKPERQGPPKVPRYTNRTRELKVRMAPYKRMLVVKALEGITESCDAISAIYKAMPAERRREWRNDWVREEFANGVKRPSRDIPCDEKAKLIFQHYDEIDVDQMIRELIWETISDELIGQFGQWQAKALGDLTGRSQVTFGWTQPTGPGDNTSQQDGMNGIRSDNPLANTGPPKPFMDWLQGVITGR